MAFWNHLRKKENIFAGIEVPEEDGIIIQPIKGEVIPLKEIGDGVFSEGILGEGCGLRPSEEVVYAPISGVISSIANTKHALGIIGDNGVEILIHVGLDTVNMNGKGFDIKVKVGDKVKCGQPVMTFSKKEIMDAGYSNITAVLVTNSNQYKEISRLHTGQGEAGEKMMFVNTQL